MKAAAGILVFVCLSVTCAVALAFSFGGLNQTVSILSLAFGLVGAAAAWISIGPPKAQPKPTAMDVLLLTIFAIASLRAFLWLIYPVENEWRVLSPNNLGDISLHLDFIRYFASGVRFWPSSPILAGTPLCYPIGVDLFNSMLLHIGVPVERGLVWTGLGGAVLTAWALWRWGGAFAIAAFLFAGGLAGFQVFQTGKIEDFQSALAWKNLFLSMFVTQRGLLYAIPCGLFLLDAWRADFFRTGSNIPRWLQFLLYVTLPLFSVHAFIFISLVLFAIFLTDHPSRKLLLTFVGSAIAPATLAVSLVTGCFSSASGLRWLPGWMQGDEGLKSWVINSGSRLWLPGWAQCNVGLTFWAVNFGISLPILLFLAWKAIALRNREAWVFVGTGLAVFALCFCIAFAPWEWDNTKLLVWAWIVCAPALWSLVLQPLPAFPRVLICLLLFFSGALSLVGGLDGSHGYKLVLRSDLAAAAQALRDVPVVDRIAIEPDFNNPVMLLGRPVLCGYEGHLWSHGLSYRQQWNDLHSILLRSPGWEELARKHNVKWIYVVGSPPVIVPAR